MKSKMTPAQNKLYNILLNLFQNEGSTFPKNREELKKNHKFFKIILDEIPGSNKWYGLNTIMTKTMDLIAEENRNSIKKENRNSIKKNKKDLFNIIRTSVLNTLDVDCSLKKIEYKESHDCLKSNKKTLYEARYRTKEVVTIEENPKADDIIKNAIKRLFINILIDSKSDTLFQQLGGTYYLVDGSKHCFQDEIDVKSFKDIIATFDDYIFQNQEIKKLIETWANELGEEVLKNDRKTLENKRKTNNNIEIEKKSNGAGSLEDFFYNENDKEKETENVVIKKQNNSKGNNNLTMVDLFKRVKENKKMKTEEGNSSNKGGYFKDSKEEEVKDVEKKDNFDKVSNRMNEREKQSNSKKGELIDDSNNKEKDVVLEMDYKPATNHNNNCGGCLTSFKEGLKNCFG